MTHFISCYKIDNVTNIVDLIFKEIAQLRSISKSIVSDHDVKFLGYF